MSNLMRQYKPPASRKRSRGLTKTGSINTNNLISSDEDEFIVGNMNGKRTLRNRVHKETIDLSHLSEDDFNLLSKILRQSKSDPNQKIDQKKNLESLSQSFTEGMQQSRKRKSEIAPNPLSVSTITQTHNDSNQSQPQFKSQIIHQMPQTLTHYPQNPIIGSIPPGFIYHSIPMQFQGSSYPIFMNSQRKNETSSQKDAEVSTEGNGLSTFDFLPNEKKSRGIQTMDDPLIESLQRENIELRKKVQKLEFEKEEHKKTLRIIEELFSEPHSVKKELKKWRKSYSDSFIEEQGQAEVEITHKKKKSNPSIPNSTSSPRHNKNNGPPIRRYKSKYNEEYVSDTDSMMGNPSIAEEYDESIRSPISIGSPNRKKIASSEQKKSVGFNNSNNINSLNNNSSNQNGQQESLIVSSDTINLKETLKNYEISANLNQSTQKLSRNIILSLPDINYYKFENLYNGNYTQESKQEFDQVLAQDN